MNLMFLLVLGVVILVIFALPKKAEGDSSSKSSLGLGNLFQPGKSHREIEDEQDIAAIAEAYREQQRLDRQKEAIAKVAALQKASK